MHTYFLNDLLRIKDSINLFINEILNLIELNIDRDMWFNKQTDSNVISARRIYNYI